MNKKLLVIIAVFYVLSVFLNSCKYEIETSNSSKDDFMATTIGESGESENSENEISSETLCSDTDVNDLKAILNDVYERYEIYMEIADCKLNCVELTEPIDPKEYYCIVNDERFSSIDDIKAFMYDLFVPELAEFYFRYLFVKGNSPELYEPAFYVENDGILYMVKDEYGGYFVGEWEIEKAEIELRNDGTICVLVPIYIATMLRDQYVTLVKDGDKWLIEDVRYDKK